MTSPLEPSVHVESMVFGGAGLGRLDGRVVFVPFTLPGETVRVRILKNKKDYAEAEPLEWIETSPERVTPPCAYFGACGGCAYQHLPYEKQILLKEKLVRDIFQRIGGWNDSLPLAPTVPSPSPLAYRSKIRMKFMSRREGSVFGYFDHYQKRLLDIPECPIASKFLQDFLGEARSDDFALFRKRRIRSHNLAMMDSSDGIRHNLMEDRPVRVTVQGRTWSYDLHAFFQINHAILPSLVDHLRQSISTYCQSPGVFWDLYCGVGFFGIALADSFARLCFVESNRKAFKFLEQNVHDNQLGGKSLTVCQGAEFLDAASLPAPDCCLVDPPRTGLETPLIRFLEGLRPRLLIYISCNPATQARDLKHFRESGWELKLLTPFDFFPQTKHIETVALMVPPP